MALDATGTVDAREALTGTAVTVLVITFIGIGGSVDGSSDGSLYTVQPFTGVVASRTGGTSSHSR